MRKRIVSCFLAALLLGTTVTTPVMAATQPTNDEEMVAANREDVQLGEPYVDEALNTVPAAEDPVEESMEEPDGVSENSLSENDITMEEEIIYSYSGDKTLAKPSKFTIASQYRNLYSYGLNYSFYQTTPSVTRPYAAGTLSTIHLQKAMESVNMMRMIAGLPSVNYNPTYTSQAQQGAVILAANNSLDNYPSQPSGMDNNFYVSGRTATQKSNIASGSFQNWRSLAWFTQNFMEDKAPGNLANVGHRRWILNPRMSSTGFGYATNKSNMAYALIYVDDRGALPPDYDFISWPSSGNFPQELCQGDTPWSVSLNPDKFDVSRMNLNNVKVSLTLPNGKVQKFTAADNGTDRFDISKPYFNINFEAAGESNAIIFKPGTATCGTGNLSGIYNVTITGIKDKKGRSATISYNVEFFNAAGYLGGTDDQATSDTHVTSFVTRLYTLCFGRQPDEGGMLDWKNSLVTKRRSGADVAYGFFFSPELKNRNLSDREFVDLCYKVMLDRNADPNGSAYWLSCMHDGVTREGIFKGFAESKEFNDLCISYGITRGTVKVTQGRDRNPGLTSFITRMYTKALGRGYDIGGLNDWCNRILDKKWSVTDATTTGFFHSREFLDKNLSNAEYIMVLYRTFLGREYDIQGFYDWLNKLDSGKMTRDQVLRGFSDSKEFRNIMKEYGL